MSAVSDAPPGVEAVAAHFKAWLKHCSGCRFATHLAVAGDVAYEVHAEVPTALDLDRTLDEYAAQKKTAIVLFPFITTETGLVDLLRRLPTSAPRWQLAERAAAELVHIGVEWLTSTGERSDAMGFAPLPSMPVPRRAPYFAIGMWPSSRCNPVRGQGLTPPGIANRVSFLDAAHSLSEAESDAMWGGTETAVGNLLTLPPDQAKRYRRVAFVLSAATAGVFPTAK